ncbi:HNH endonuclease [Mycolicibacterium baixiangningiae]|uniref:HNH endonuclease n=1 Tax=Mycolicibacterium baixiangningiae TaxID=2761578 RepID=UPI0018693F0E|nr:HNH endonuclease [Mycolicibacterium baixiangningiae]
MTAPARVNDAKAKRLRARIRARGDACHICGHDIDYTAHHHDPRSFQLDHLWQIANGGPAYDITNCAAAHRKCNRARSDTIDAITIAAAASYGIDLTSAQSKGNHASNGHLCTGCNGYHNPGPGTTFITARNWWSTTVDDNRPRVDLTPFGGGL